MNKRKRLPEVEKYTVSAPPMISTHMALENHLQIHFLAMTLTVVPPSIVSLVLHCSLSPLSLSHTRRHAHRDTHSDRWMFVSCERVQ